MACVDTIIVLEDGKIADIGSPEHLLKSKGYLERIGLTLSNYDIIQEIPDAEHSEFTRGASYVSVDVTKETIESNTKDVTRKNGDMSIYEYYFASSGHTAVGVYILSTVLWMFFTEFPSQ
jgi:ATP-binding cassette subfamily C (CFTR/MRP) protein 1